jgi:hypothetical protein
MRVVVMLGWQGCELYLFFSSSASVTCSYYFCNQNNKLLIQIKRKEGDDIQNQGVLILPLIQI